MGNFLTDWLETFAAARPLRKLLLLLLSATPVAMLVAAYLWLHQTPYSVLFVRLSDRSGGEVMAALEQLDIPYRLAPDSGAIEVPADRLFAARFKLAARGLPKSTEQGALPSESAVSSFGLSQFQEQLRYQHQLETELVRSIASLDAIATARVHLALPKASPFLRDPPPVTAAVLVQLHPQRALTNEQVAAIQHMVAASVPRLKPADVRVLDPHGELLGVPPAGADARHAAVEADLARRIGAVLSPWLAADTVRPQVTATLFPDGRIRRLNASVVLAQDASPDTLAKASALAREAVGFDARRGDSLSVFAIPPASRPARTVPDVALRPTAARPAAIDLPGLPLAGAAAILLLLGLKLLGRRATGSRQDASDAESRPEVDGFDSLLQTARAQTMDNPRVTADVIRLWMRA